MPSPDDPFGFTATGPPDPQAIGQTASVTIEHVPCGFTCSFSINWPNGAAQPGLAPHAIVNGDKARWTWSWQVPSSTWGGTAHFTLGCTAPGFPSNPTEGTFSVSGPPPPTPTATT
jgi:hypothetical protein